MAQKAALALAIVLFIVGLAVGYGVGYAVIPRPQAPEAAVPTPRTVTITVTPAPTALSGEVRVGALLPLTGELASFAAEMKAVLTYAEGEINEYLSKLGRPWKIRFVIEDTGLDPKTHLSKLMTLHAAGIKIFIGGVSSGELAEALRYCNENNILIISPSSTSPALALKDMALRFTPNDLHQGKAIAKIMWERGIRWLVPMWQGSTWGDGLARATIEAFKELCRASGEECGVIEPGIRYDPKAKVFTAEVDELARLVSEAVARHGRERVGVLLVSYEEAAAIFAVAKDYPVLWEVAWQGSDGTANTAPLLRPEIAEMVVAVKFYNTMASPEISPLSHKVKELINKELGRDPMGYTYFTYDIAWAIALAIDAVGRYDPVAVKEVLPSILERYMGASGYVVLDENGDRAPRGFDIWAVIKEGDTYVWRVVGYYDYLQRTTYWK